MSHSNPIKEIDEFPRRIKIFFWVIVFLIILGTIGFVVLTGVSFEDATFRTVQTLAFVFSDDSSLSERLLEIFLGIVGVFLIWWVLWSVADMLLDGNLQKYLNKKVDSLVMSLKNKHVIIVGGGRIGGEIASNLLKKKKNFIIIENNSETVKALKRKGFSVFEGNAEEDVVLIGAGIKKATKIILTLPKTETNILATLAAKEINPSIDVYSRANEQKFVSKLKKAGAKIVIVPEIVAGDNLTKLIEE